MAEDAIEVFDHLGWDKDIHLNGCSMGGMIALELASTWPERFSSLTLTSTSAGRQVPPVSNLYRSHYSSKLELIYFIVVEGYYNIESFGLYQGT